MERSGTLVAGQTKEAAVLRKAANRKKRTTKELSIFFLLALVIALRTPRQPQEAATQGTPISPSVFIRWVVRWVVSLFTFFSFFTFYRPYVIRAYDGLKYVDA